MKIKCILYSLLVVSAVSAQSQQTPPVPPTSPASPGQSVAPPPNPPPGLQPRQQLPGGLRPSQIPPGLNRIPVTNQFGVVTNFTFTNEFGSLSNELGLITNEFGVVTNMLQGLSNQFGAFTNQFGASTNLSPTGASGTNRLFETNSFFATNQNGLVFQDQAISQFDRTLLIRIRATVLPRLRTTSPFAPVHFLLNQGAVTLVGFIISIEERQQVLTSVQAVPGVANVIDNMMMVSQDMAMTDADRALLGQIRMAIPAQPIPTATVGGPQFLVVQEGQVAIVGVVRSVEEGQRIMRLVRSTPGVVQVAPALTIGMGFGAGAGTTVVPTGQ